MTDRAHDTGAEAQLKVEFTVEPFVAGKPGAHVQAAVQAVRDCGIAPDIGPFGTSFEVSEGDAEVVVGRLVRAAFGEGAQRLSLQVER